MAVAEQAFKGFVTGATRALLDAADVSDWKLSPVAVVQADKVAQFGVVNAAGTGIVWEKEMADVSYDATVAGSDANLTFVYNDGTTKVINLPKENFLSAGSYDDTTHILTLTMENGDTITVDMSDLVDVVGVADTSSVHLENNSNVLTATVKVSADLTNVLQIKSDGLYVPEADENYITSVTSSNSVSLGVTAGALTADLKVSGTANNAIAVQSDGVYAYAPQVFVVS